MNSRKAKKQIQLSLFRGQKYKFQGYPQWYNDQLATNMPVSVHLFQDQLEKALHFYQKQATKLHFANNVLNIQLSAVNRQIEELQMMLAQVEDNQNSSAQDKKKRFRRCAYQIQRNYVCPIQNCQKSYGTEGSMAQHMRLKHPGFSYVMADLKPTKQQNIKSQKKQKVQSQERLKRQARWS